LLVFLANGLVCFIGAAFLFTGLAALFVTDLRFDTAVLFAISFTDFLGDGLEAVLVTTFFATGFGAGFFTEDDFFATEVLPPDVCEDFTEATFFGAGFFAAFFAADFLIAITYLLLF